MPPGGGPASQDARGGHGSGSEGEPRPRRERRRAVGGTVPPSPEPKVEQRASEDLDVAWGDQPAGSDDERFLREVPPHW